MNSTSLGTYLKPLPLIAVLRGITPAEVPAIAAALFDNGFRILEVPLNSPDPYASIGALAATFGQRCLTGAGTVLRREDVARVADAGGRLIVMPHADVAIVHRSKTSIVPQVKEHVIERRVLPHDDARAVGDANAGRKAVG